MDGGTCYHLRHRCSADEELVIITNTTWIVDVFHSRPSASYDLDVILVLERAVLSFPVVDSTSFSASRITLLPSPEPTSPELHVSGPSQRETAAGRAPNPRYAALTAPMRPESPLGGPIWRAGRYIASSGHEMTYALSPESVPDTRAMELASPRDSRMSLYDRPGFVDVRHSGPFIGF